jgi:hypothetical protein
VQQLVLLLDECAQAAGQILKQVGPVLADIDDARLQLRKILRESRARDATRKRRYRSK